MDTDQAAARGKQFADRKIDDIGRYTLQRILSIVIVAMFIGFIIDTAVIYFGTSFLLLWIFANILGIMAVVAGYISLKKGTIQYRITAELFIVVGAMIFAAYMYEVAGWIFTNML